MKRLKAEKSACDAESEKPPSSNMIFSGFFHRLCGCLHSTKGHRMNISRVIVCGLENSNGTVFCEQAAQWQAGRARWREDIER